jgi:hypothetical protein
VDGRKLMVSVSLRKKNGEDESQVDKSVLIRIIRLVNTSKSGLWLGGGRDEFCELVAALRAV